MARRLYFDSYTEHQDRVAAGTAKPEDYPRRASADLTMWMMTISSLAGLWLNFRQYQAQRRQAAQQGDDNG